MIPVTLEKSKRRQNFWKVKQLHCQQKLTRLRLVECDHENCGMKWIRKSCVFDTFLFGGTWKHEDIRKVEVKIFLWANLEKSKNRKISAKWRKKRCLKRGKSLRGKFKFQNRRRRLLSFNEITKGLRKEFNVPEN